jgi:hypothetical protein
MRNVWAALAILSCCATAAGAGDVRPVVVEVYTSQGCSSCGPANALAGRLAQRPGVLVLSFPVTYWDIFGWRDTLASADNTNRQKAYAGALRRGGVYTPQMIIDGVRDVPAARENAVLYALTMAMVARDEGAAQDIESAFRRGATRVTYTGSARDKNSTRQVWSVEVALARQPNDLRVAIERAPEAARRDNIDATVWLFRMRANASARVGGGENNGQTINYRNVVTQIASVGRWRGEALAFTVPKPTNRAPAHDAVAVVVQQGGYGRVIGAASLTNAAAYAAP